MPDEPQLIYLEPDDEITSVVRRLRAADSRSVVIVAPGRSRATSSSVALRLLAQVAAEEKRGLALVADPATRAVAGEAGIAAFASVAEAISGKSAVEPAAVAPRAPIHVVRGVPDLAPVEEGGVPPLPVGRSGPSDETMVVRTRKVPPTGPPERTARSWLRWWPLLAALLIVVLATGAALLPAATVRVTAATTGVGPISYPLQMPVTGRQTSDLRATLPGTATGQRLEQFAATGGVTFFNWSLVAVEVPQGTQVSVGGAITFTTAERIVVPRGRFNGQTIQSGQAKVGVTAVAAGPGGNVAATAIDTIDDAAVRNFLRGDPGNPNRLVSNEEATAGGAETAHPVIQQVDVDAVVAAIQADLTTQLATALGGQEDRLYAGPQEGEAPAIVVPPELVGTEDVPTFELSGTLSLSRPYVTRAEVLAAARAALLEDPTAASSGTTILPASIEVEIGEVAAAADQMTVQVVVRAEAAATIDEDAVRDRVAGLTVEEAQAALVEIGSVEVDLWPGWLDRLPRLAFRISVETVGPDSSASPSPSSSASTTAPSSASLSALPSAPASP